MSEETIPLKKFNMEQKRTLQADAYEQTFELRGHAYNAARDICPEARKPERDMLIEWLQPQPGEQILDAPAGGGYLADGIRDAIGTAEGILCQEPSEKFASAIDPAYKQLRAPLTAQDALQPKSLDAVASLAGLHHIEDKRAIYKAWFDALKPGGRFALADVQAQTGTGVYLNGFVDQHTPGGHDGIFLEPGLLGEDLRGVGFVDVLEELVNVHWQFPDRAICANFCRSLFDVRGASLGEVWDALGNDVGLQETENGVTLLWQLRYAKGFKPAD